MATKDKSTESVYRVTEVIGTSAQSWDDAAKTAVETAAGTLRDLRIAEVVKMDVKIEDGKVIEYRTRLQLSFQYESEFGRTTDAASDLTVVRFHLRTYLGCLSQRRYRPDEQQISGTSS